MAVFSGCFYALGTGISNLGVFQEATTYTRPAVSTTGTALSGLTQAIGQITGPTGPVGGSLTYGAIFDAITGGNCLCYWNWNVTTLVPANFLAVTGNMQFNSYLQTALNLSLLGGQGASGSAIDAGAQIGTMIGNPLIAGVRLGIQSGNLVALGSNKVSDVGAGLYWQANGLNVGFLDGSGNLSLLGTAAVLTTTGKLTVAGGGTDMLFTVAGTPVMSILNTGILTLKGTVTASGTPA